MRASLLAFAALLLALGFSGCTSAYSVFVDGRPDLGARELSDRIAKRYHAIGFVLSPVVTNEEFPLGRWNSKGLGGIAHAEKDGALWIWITPPPGSDTASSIVEDVKKIVHEEAPRASVRVVESRSPDLR